MAEGQQEIEEVTEDADVRYAATKSIARAFMKLADRVLDHVLRELRNLDTPLTMESAEAAVYSLRTELRRELLIDYVK